jgi:hypothetical protein
MSTPDEAVIVTPSYSLNQLREVGSHAPLTVTPVPSRSRTYSRALQFPEIALHVGKRSRE